jgi:hypothetical protein
MAGEPYQGFELGLFTLLSLQTLKYMNVSTTSLYITCYVSIVSFFFCFFLKPSYRRET